jgi:hypothetical protein
MKGCSVVQTSKATQQDWRHVAGELEQALGVKPGTLAIERRLNYEAHRLELVVHLPNDLKVPPITVFGGYPVVFEKSERIEVGPGLK